MVSLHSSSRIFDLLNEGLFLRSTFPLDLLSMSLHVLNRRMPKLLKLLHMKLPQELSPSKFSNLLAAMVNHVQLLQASLMFCSTKHPQECTCIEKVVVFITFEHIKCNLNILYFLSSRGGAFETSIDNSYLTNYGQKKVHK
jgi:hypothetical protein